MDQIWVTFTTPKFIPSKAIKASANWRSIIITAITIIIFAYLTNWNKLMLYEHFSWIFQNIYIVKLRIIFYHCK